MNPLCQGDCYGVEWMVLASEYVSGMLSMEAIKPGTGAPDWLLNAIISGERLIVLHPNEASRKQTISNLHSMSSGTVVDSSRHLTLQRMLAVLHIDLRLPSIMNDDGITFELTHRELSLSASEYGFPLIHPNPEIPWSRSRTRRVLSLHREIFSLRNPSDWEDDPCAAQCDMVLKKLESKMGMTHPSRKAHVLLNKLNKSGEIPFTLKGISGIIILDHASSLTDVELAILQRLSQLVNIHQLVNPGSHRLGFHGEYIEDIHPIRRQEDLPAWVPNHEVLVPKADLGWQSPKSENEIYHLMVESEGQSISAIGDILSKIDGDVTIVDGNPKSLERLLKPYLDNQGIKLRGAQNSTLSSSAVSRILSIIELPRGEDAWSLDRLADMTEQIGLPMTWSILNLEHPEYDDWKPNLHVDVMAELARGFHVLSGRGSLGRWLSTLANATPRFSTDETHKKSLEESHWWVSIIARWMYPILSKADKEVAMKDCVGCISGRKLPLPEPLTNQIEWFNSLLGQIDWSLLATRNSIESSSIPGLQHFTDSVAKLAKELGAEFGESFFEILQNLAANTQIPSRRGNDTNLRILSPSQAHGIRSEILILNRFNSETWSMKTQPIPWLDEKSRLRLGINRPDSELRKGRHYLRNLLDSSKIVVILDSSLQDGVELSGPLEEWITTANLRPEEYDFERAPPFIDPDDWNPKTPDRAWVWQSIQDHGLRLVHKVSSMEMLAAGVRTHNSGILPRDDAQRSGLALIEGREICSMPLSKDTILEAAKLEILPDQYQRRVKISDYDNGETFPFTESGKLVRTNDFKITPNRNHLPNARNSSQWPHLGEVKEKKKILGIDPRPIVPPSTNIDSLDDRVGLGTVNLALPRIWSQSRLQAWLFCPRSAWYERHLKLGREDNVPEDLAANARGNIIHFVEEAVLRAHGLEKGIIPENPKNLVNGKLDGFETAWQAALETLSEKAPWMKRADGVAAHRCRDLVGVSPSDWTSWLEGDEHIPIGGRLGRMIESDFSLVDCAPLASEWEINSKKQPYVIIDLPSSAEQKEGVNSFKFTGFVDKIDSVIVDYEYDNNSETIPLDVDLGSEIPVSKLVIIRDIKSVDGPKDDGRDNRHMKGLFDEVQLALYARAWEVCNPGHRVIGVGVTQVGIDTQQWVELDPEFVHLLSDSKIGIITQYLANQYRRPGEKLPAKSNPFRAWMRERITTALRVIENAKAGKIPCNCSTIDSCRSINRGGR